MERQIMKLSNEKKFFYLNQIKVGIDNSLGKVLSKNDWAVLSVYIQRLKNDLKESKNV